MTHRFGSFVGITRWMQCGDQIFCGTTCRIYIHIYVSRELRLRSVWYSPYKEEKIPYIIPRGFLPTTGSTLYLVSSMFALDETVHHFWAVLTKFIILIFVYSTSFSIVTNSCLRLSCSWPWNFTLLGSSSITVGKSQRWSTSTPGDAVGERP